MFQLENVTYKNILQLKFLQIQTGSVTSIIGKSGSGKSTLLKLLNNMISSDSGVIYYNDKSIEEIEPVELRRQVVTLTQYPAIFEGTVKDNLLLGLKLSEKNYTSVNDEVLSKTLAMFNLQTKLDVDANKLSGGEQQRLAFARIMLMKAPVYLLDEPTSSLDEETEDLVIGRFISRAKAEKTTVVMVTHSMKVAETYSDFIINMEDVNAYK
ncbi:ATP-binding cassette domain-containing protein [Cytobacillus sp. IB215665]|uniref:ABC transporter ATP-binding protein n=1 Tax=Cytobacillus sp. IB215665 TaxID=3097357 RepID=UPI002A15D673|nr:ATP-binding cassette domain-containing protein [Cytobacillus sp. IB215665]MDX8366661.1 ATP-binding cassette domain-containing protein [Cytobacillus sp. IB215665]